MHQSITVLLTVTSWITFTENKLKNSTPTWKSIVKYSGYVKIQIILYRVVYLYVFYTQLQTCSFSAWTELLVC